MRRNPHNKNLIHVSAADVKLFNRQWPCSSIPVKACYFEFDTSGDLVDTNCIADGPEVLALCQDAQNKL